MSRRLIKYLKHIRSEGYAPGDEYAEEEMDSYIRDLEQEAAKIDESYTRPQPADHIPGVREMVPADHYSLSGILENMPIPEPESTLLYKPADSRLLLEIENLNIALQNEREIANKAMADREALEEVREGLECAIEYAETFHTYSKDGLSKYKIAINKAKHALSLLNEIIGRGETVMGDASTRKDEAACASSPTIGGSPSEIPVLEAITQAIQQARMDYDANSEDFNGRLDDTDLVAYVHDAIHPYLRTTAPVSGCHAVLDNMYGALKTIMALAENEDDEAYRIAKQAISEAEMKHAD